MPLTTRDRSVRGDAIPYAAAFGAALIPALALAGAGEEYRLGATLLGLIALASFAKVIWAFPTAWDDEDDPGNPWRDEDARR
jgi:hypothetical protein